MCGAANEVVGGCERRHVSHQSALECCRLNSTPFPSIWHNQAQRKRIVTTTQLRLTVGLFEDSYRNQSEFSQKSISNCSESIGIQLGFSHDSVRTRSGLSQSSIRTRSERISARNRDPLKTRSGLVRNQSGFNPDSLAMQSEINQD